jgi:hypothetical protein
MDGQRGVGRVDAEEEGVGDDEDGEVEDGDAEDVGEGDEGLRARGGEGEK